MNRILVGGLRAVIVAASVGACTPPAPAAPPRPALSSATCVGESGAEVIFSNARQSRETGDISGIELALRWDERTVTGSFRIARGEFMGSHPVEGKSLGGGRVTLVLNEGESGLRLDGQLTCDELVGVIGSPPQRPEDSVGFRRVESRGQLPRWPEE